MVTRSDKLATIGPSLADLLLEVFCFAASPSLRGVAAIVSKARQTVKDAATSSLELARDRSDLGKRIADALTTKVKAAREQCLDRGIDASLLVQAESAVAALISTDTEHDLVVLSAVRDPAGFENYLRTRAASHRQQIDEQAEPYFDVLVGAVAAAYVDIAPWSDSFVVVALKSLLGECSDIKELLNDIHIENRQLLSQILEVVESLTTAIKELSMPSRTERVRFGSRPNVVKDRFCEREEQKHLDPVLDDDTSERTVLVGMRGCGKTQLAAALAKECEDANWNLVAWINAVSPESIESDLVELAKWLKIDTSDLPTQGEVIRRCLNHLQSVGPADRLIVFDNVEDINHLTGLIPSGDGVRVVATTTNKVGWEHQGWNSIKVGVFDRNTSIEYLLTVTNSADREAADALAERLGDLPLAVAQAAATARNKDLSLARYLQRLDSRGEELVIRPIPGDEYTDDVVTVLWMAIEDAVDSMKNGTKEMARRQLGALALLAEAGVPTRWLDPTIEQQDDRGLQGAHRAEDEDAHDALTELIHRSIVQQSANGSITTLHRLQAHALRSQWNENETNEASHAAAHILTRIDINNIALADTEERRKDARDLIYQLRSIADQQHSSSLFREEATLEATDHAIYNAGLLGIEHETIALHKAVDILTQAHGKNNETVENVRNDLADACLKRGYMSMERELRTAGKFGRILTLQDDIDDAVMAHLIEALNQESAHEYDRATKEYEHALQACPPATGTNVRYITGIRQALADRYSESNRTEDAIAQYRKAIEESPALRGPGHPSTDILRKRLAALLIAQDEHAEAIQLLNEAYSNLCNTFGKADDLTLSTLMQLCDAQVLIGEHDKAIILYKEVLETQPPIRMSDTLKGLLQRCLAEAYASAGQHDTAVKLLDSMLDELHQQHTTEKTKSNDGDFYIHDLCSIQYQLASILYESETVDELLRATEILEGMISNCEITYGAQHPKTMDAHFLLSQVNARISNLR